MQKECHMNDICIKGKDILNLKNVVTRLAKPHPNTQGTPLIATDHKWGKAVSKLCPANHYQCGIWARQEPKLGKPGDDTGINGIGIYCCPF